MTRRIICFFALMLTLSVSASAQIYVDGANDPSMTTAVAARQWFIGHTGQTADFPEVGLSASGVQTVLANLQQFQTQFNLFVSQYKAQVENANATSARIKAATYQADSTALNAKISGLTTATLAKINGQLSAIDALAFSSAIEQFKHNIITGGTDPDLGAAVSSRNLKEINMVAHSHGMVPQGGGNGGMVPGYTATNTYTMGTLIGGTFHVDSASVTPQEVFATYPNGNIHTIDYKFVQVLQGIWASGGTDILNVTNGQLVPSGSGSYAAYYYEPNGITTPYSNMCASEAIGTASGSQFYVAARFNSTGYGYVFAIRNGGWALDVFSSAHPTGYTLASGSQNPQVGDGMTICTIGSSVSVYFDDLALSTVTNTEVTTGFPGLIGATWAVSPSSIFVTAPITLQQTSQITGSTTCQSGCPTGVYHTPNVLSQSLGGRQLGGAQSGPSVLAASYINDTFTTNFAFDDINSPLGDNPTELSVAPEVICPIAHVIFGPPADVKYFPFYIEWAFTWETEAGVPTYLGGGTYLYPVHHYCVNGTPDWNPSTTIDNWPTASSDFYFVGGNFMFRWKKTDIWQTLGQKIGLPPLGILLFSSPNPPYFPPHDCTHTGPQK